MPFAHPPLSLSAVITQLRTAGCVYAEDEAELLLAAPFTPAEMAAALEQRVAGFPLEHILGWAEFCGLRIAVEPGVFVPRRRTEFLVREAAALLRTRHAVPEAPGLPGDVVVPGGAVLPGVAAGVTGFSGGSNARPAGLPDGRSAARIADGSATSGTAAGAVVVDLCCGSGAVGTALATFATGIELHASDIAPAAVRCAHRNIDPAGGRVYEGDLYSPLPARLMGNVDILAVNAPYVPTGSISSMPHEARVHEPSVSLDGGPDGLEIQRKVAAEARTWLKPGGHLLIETSRRQANGTAAAVARGGLTPRIITSEEFDATVVVGLRS
jgi:release factor glutamine methyltransferase